MDPFAFLAEAYEAWYETPLGAYVIAEEERALKGLLPPGESLLEVGAGTGYWLRRLPYPRRVGVEPSEAMLAVGRRRAPEATWVRAWGEALPFSGESFDVVLLFTTLEFVEDVERVLLEARRVLRPGGALVVGVLEALSPWAALYRRLGEKGVLPWARARFLARVVVAGDPTLQLLEVIPAAKKALERAGLSLRDVDVIEVNEAFASVVLAFLRELGADPEKVNPNGGAIAHGHPLGATGAVLMTKLLYELERTGGEFGLQVMCIGHGQATATVIQRL